MQRDAMRRARAMVETASASVQAQAQAQARAPAPVRTFKSVDGAVCPGVACSAAPNSELRTRCPALSSDVRGQKVRFPPTYLPATATAATVSPGYHAHQPVESNQIESNVEPASTTQLHFTRSTSGLRTSPYLEHKLPLHDNDGDDIKTMIARQRPLFLRSRCETRTYPASQLASREKVRTILVCKQVVRRATRHHSYVAIAGCAAVSPTNYIISLDWQHLPTVNQQARSDVLTTL